ncbi:MAG: hypothetical protein ABL888_13175 [Pirellulaceae bacterium]
MKKLLALAVGCVAVLAFGQDATAQGRGGGMMGRMQTRLMTMVRGGEALQKELNLSDEQKEKLTKLGEEAREAMGAARGGGEVDQDALKDIEKEAIGVLDEKQKTRLLGIHVQVAGFASLKDDDVAKAIGLEGESREKVNAKIDEVSEDMTSKMQELFQSGDREAMRGKMTELRDAANKDVMALLSEEQTKKLEELKGAKFEMPQGRGGPGGGGGGTEKGKGKGKGKGDGGSRTDF